MSADQGIKLFWKNRDADSRFRTGVSLHSHTLFSQEGLDFIPRYSRRVPILRQVVAHHMDRVRRETGRELDFSSAWWTPPLPPKEAYDLEVRQIEECLNLPALVSLTDHDSIEAGLRLHVIEGTSETPVSVEWTVPYRNSFFHLGLHNLPVSSAPAVMSELRAATAHPEPRRLEEILFSITDSREALVVLNHPLWDEKGIGAARHRTLLESFLKCFGRFLHAFELNGWRTWRENAAVIRLARAAGFPLVSGGDRHGREPNAILNLTNTSTFPEFVEEVRFQKRSQVLFMPQYRDSRTYRVVRTICDILRHDKGHEFGWSHWSDRIFYRRADSVVLPLSRLWSKNGGPAAVRFFVSLIGLLESTSVQAALKAALLDKENVAL